ncbi:TIR domain-containing protein [Spiroplasma floricola]|uniref:Molecular chaperone Tir n=1 Tax=Spiroplasma floricola 23-6 TaxID=1336749 RepID=A0A2K8SCT7_9MOLU|nr:TIR domain-containing protein [Spiroplasma floricola]AUB31274.1 molecular chaperone Tir [Spiroplasma floricola 23-6]
MKKVFYSFDYDDNWKVQQVRNIGVVTNENVVEPSKWETVKRSGNEAIKNWINKEINNSDVVVVLIGQYTYNSRWVKYEIQYALNSGKKIIGIHINNLGDKYGRKCLTGNSPFNEINDYRARSIEIFNPSISNALNEIKSILLKL